MKRDEMKRLCARPLRLRENRVWRTYSGGAMMGKWRGRSEADGQMPEDWMGSTTRAVNAAHPGPADEGLSRIEGAAVGITEDVLLRDLIVQFPEEMLGAAHVRLFGAQTALLVKALDAAERLAIQAHPDRRDAMRYFSSPFGKTEAWYVLATREGIEPRPAVLVGFREDMTREKWRRLFETQDIAGMQAALHRIEVQPGDVILLEGGVPHAIGEGCFLIEIQEPTDYTLRVERVTPRGMPLSDVACHQGAGFDAMLEMFHYEFLTREETLARWRKQPRKAKESADGRIDVLLDAADTPCFSLLRMRVNGRLLVPSDGGFRLAVVTQGTGTLHAGDDAMTLSQGDCLFIPAGVRETVWQAEGMTVLLCAPPKTVPQA